MSKEWVVLGLVALAGFLIGGVYATWKTTKLIATVLGLAALLAVGAAAAWYFS